MSKTYKTKTRNLSSDSLIWAQQMLKTMEMGEITNVDMEGHVETI